MQESIKMPEMPTGGGWETWIIGTFASIVATMVTTIVTMVRFIQGQYQKTIDDMTQRVTKIESENCELHKEAAACREDRATLTGRIEVLKGRVEDLEQTVKVARVVH